MNLASALLKQVIHERDLDTWANLRKHYLPSEYSKIYGIISGHVDKYHKLPTFEDLKFEVRDQSTLDRISLIEREEVDAEPFLLLDYLKSEFAQKEVIGGLDKFVETSLTHSSAEETIESIYKVIADVESKVELVKPRDNIEKVELFDTEEEMEASLPLGLNEEYDQEFIFPNDSLILLGGYRGSGKSIVCNNIAQATQDRGKSVIKFTIEMSLRQELQRQCAIATGVPHRNLRFKELSVMEWDKVARWWASRFEDGFDIYEQVYLKDNDFTKFHMALIQKPLALPAIDFVHTPDLSMSKFKAETLRRLNKYGDSVGLIVADYLNKIKFSDFGHANKFEWMEQLQVADALKTFSEDIGIPIVTPFQTKADGSVKFPKDILVPADAAFTLKAGADFIDFENIKMRHMEEKGFTSKIDWMSLKCGPESAVVVNDDGEEVEEPQDI